MPAFAAPSAARAPRVPRWLRWVALAVLALMALAAGVLMWRLPDDQELAALAAADFERRFGIPLDIGQARWALRPVPILEFGAVSTRQPRPITLRRLAAYPQWRALLQRRIEFSRVEVDGLVLPRESVRAFRGREPRAAQAPAPAAAVGWTLADIPVHTLRLHDATWIDRRGIALAYDVEADFAERWRPRELHIARPGTSPPAQAHLVREGEVVDDSAGQGDQVTERWRVSVDVGGGSWNGEATLLTDPGGHMRLQATLTPQQIDLEALVSAFGRHSAVAGRMSGQTTVDARGDRPGDLVRSLHTRTQFTVRGATLRRFDLARFVSSAGQRREGQTALDALTGTLDTQATEAGTVMRYENLHARSGVLTASGQLRVLNRRMQGEVAVDLVDGVVGVPLRLGGTLDRPDISLTPGAMAGAAAGSAVLPGIGTAIGARIGQQLERLFGGETPPATPTPKPAR